MKKTAFALTCVFIGYALAHGLPTSSSAQVVAPVAPRWEQVCEMKGGLGTDDTRRSAIALINESLAARGRDGWEIASTPVFVTGSSRTGTGTTWSELMVCYRRPAR